MNHLIFGGVVMKKLLSFLLSSIILMGSSVVTLADTKIDGAIGGNNDKIEVDSEVNVKNDSLTLSGNNISIKITSDDLNFTLPKGALFYTWNAGDTPGRTISFNNSLDDNKKVKKFNINFVNNSENVQKVKLEFSNIIPSVGESDSAQEIIEVKKDNLEPDESSYSNKTQSYIISLKVENDRTTSVTISCNLGNIKFSNLLKNDDIENIKSGSTVTKSMFKLTISLVPETASGS